ncbi:hypothetical protein [Citrobacter phage Ci1]|nr:hypothetical protein [Citrobacter phage Ci1]
MRTMLSREQKPLRGKIDFADFFRWETNDGKFVLCVTGYVGHVSPYNSIRTSWVESQYEEDGNRFVETRNSRYQVDMQDHIWKNLGDNLKDAELDVERMKS